MEQPVTEAERAVLEVFRSYLVAPGQMLCFYGPDLQRLHEPLARLTDKRLLVAESFRGAYSLTEAGYAAVQSSGCAAAVQKPVRKAGARPKSRKQQ